MLEYWYKEKRTLVDFRRGPLGPFFDGFAAHLQAQKYAETTGIRILGTCCQFNAFLMEKGISSSEDLSESLAQAFLEAYHASARAAAGPQFSPRPDAGLALKHLFAYLIAAKVFTPPKPKPIIEPFTWILDPYRRHLQTELELSPHAVAFHHRQIVSFLRVLGPKAQRGRLRTLKAEAVEKFVSNHFRSSPMQPRSLTWVLRLFFRYCASKGYMQADYSGLLPTIRTYRKASLPKGMDDSALEKMLKAIKQDTPIGARDYAIVILMMAYGIRGIAAAQLLLDDIDWQRSKIRIRARKAGKEVVLPLTEPVGEAIIQYLRHRPQDRPFREVFLSARAPFSPIDGGAISRIVSLYLKRAGVKTARSGARTLRHSWAIRALAHDSPIKAIADVLGHRCIDTTFIYAKADLNSLREVALPWPGKK